MDPIRGACRFQACWTRHNLIIDRQIYSGVPRKGIRDLGRVGTLSQLRGEETGFGLPFRHFVAVRYLRTAVDQRL